MSKRVSNRKGAGGARSRVRYGWRKSRARAALDNLRQRAGIEAIVGDVPAPAMPANILDKARRFFRLGGRGK